MIKLYNDILPLKGFKALNICGILFVRKGKVLSDRNIRHEQIHTCQMRELLFIGFYLWYVAEWLVRLLMCMDAKRAYYDISFEREAYGNEADEDYLNKRRRYVWIRLLTLNDLSYGEF